MSLHSALLTLLSPHAGDLSMDMYVAIDVAGLPPTTKFDAAAAAASSPSSKKPTKKAAEAAPNKNNASACEDEEKADPTRWGFRPEKKGRYFSMSEDKLTVPDFKPDNSAHHFSSTPA
jgi:hypothetical protein